MPFAVAVASNRLKPSSFYDRVVDVMEELLKFTLLTRDLGSYLVDRYSERKESAAELGKRLDFNKATGCGPAASGTGCDRGGASSATAMPALEAAPKSPAAVVDEGQLPPKSRFPVSTNRAVRAGKQAGQPQTALAAFYTGPRLLTCW